jgi:hypothetical protein
MTIWFITGASRASGPLAGDLDLHRLPNMYSSKDHPAAQVRSPDSWPARQAQRTS